MAPIACAEAAAGAGRFLSLCGRHQSSGPGRVRISLIAGVAAFALSGGWRVRICQYRRSGEERLARPQSQGDPELGNASLAAGGSGATRPASTLASTGTSGSDRCGSNSCGRVEPSVGLGFDRASGKLLTSFGGGMIVFPTACTWTGRQRLDHRWGGEQGGDERSSGLQIQPGGQGPDDALARPAWLGTVRIRSTSRTT